MSTFASELSAPQLLSRLMRTLLRRGRKVAPEGRRMLIAVSLAVLLVLGLLLGTRAYRILHPAPVTPAVTADQVIPNATAGSFGFRAVAPDTVWGWAGMVPLSIVRTTDRGQHWRTVHLWPAATLYYASFSDANRGVALLRDEQGQGIVAATSNGGVDWTESELPTLPSNPEVFASFLSVEEGWIAITSAHLDPGDPSYKDVAILRTTDGGKTWSSTSRPRVQLGLTAEAQPGSKQVDVIDPEGPTGLVFVDSRYGFITTASSGGSAPPPLLTTDGGVTWKPVVLPPGPPAGPGDTVAYSVVQPQTLLRCHVPAPPGTVILDRMTVRAPQGGDSASITPLDADQAKIDALNQAFASHDEGATWTPTACSPLDWKSIARHLPALPAAYRSVFMPWFPADASASGGVLWLRIASNDLDACAHPATTVQRSACDRLPLTISALLRSSDGGRTWETVSTRGLPQLPSPISR